MTHDHHDDEPTTPAPSTENRPRPGTGAGAAPSTAAEWRDLLRRDELPDELASLPRRKRRRAAKRWRSARREEREQAIRKARGKPPTTLAVPALALLAAAAVAVGALMWPSDDAPARTKSSPSPTAAVSSDPPTPTAPAAGPPAQFADPDKVAEGFASAYSTRLPLQDGSHKAAVKRAAPYASGPLVDNLTRHGDKDFDRLVATQATEARPTKTKIGQPSGTQRPAPDTSVRVYRQATIAVAVKGTDPYTYTRHLTIEVSRADTGAPWMVTRVLGIEE
ncbi:hypothetical protein [Streptomyces yaizuensis]|uniref:Mce-associated membrane protein n=1 Tax=Streptomyces yaizuensis TaxID=2989713 RepID=A0ABQ5P6R8_9ACTN|nr:hypothetical protein [Streptomyces sp. YSPA8]GLF98280.1 hypothetical protein SYYSPA8_28305 [Streptomyces sp. YSPA8]